MALIKRKGEFKNIKFYSKFKINQKVQPTRILVATTINQVLFKEFSLYGEIFSKSGHHLVATSVSK